MSKLDDKIEFEVWPALLETEGGSPAPSSVRSDVRAQLRVSGERISLNNEFVNLMKEDLTRQLNDMIYGDILRDVLELREMVMPAVRIDHTHDTIDAKFHAILEKLT